ncbi:hypothetical protein GCM10027343_03840 [Noviherbaspirillum agri]
MQEFVVGLIVAFAAWSILVRYTPKAARRAVRRISAQMFESMGMRKLAARLRKKQEEADCASGCGSCGGCGPAVRKGANPPGQSSIKPDVLRRMTRTAGSGRGR